MLRRMAFVLVAPMAAWAERCDAPPPIAQLLHTLPDDNAERRKALEAAARSNPGDFWLNKLFLEGSVYHKIAVRERYRARRDKEPTIDNQFLYGRSLVGFDTREALRVYSTILARDPDYPWVRYSQLEIYRSEGFRDRARLRASFEAVARVCPSWTEPYEYLTALHDDAIAPYADRLRKLLQTATDARALRLYQTLWAAEFRLKRDDEKARIAEDLQRLRGIQAPEATVIAGAKLIGDDALAKSAARPRPLSIAQARSDWRRLHPYPRPEDGPEKKREYAQALLDASAEWIAKAPDRVPGYSAHLSALKMLDAPAEEIAKAAEDLVRVARTDDRADGASFIAGVAREFVTRGIHLDRVPALIDEAVKSFSDPEAVIDIDLAPGNADMTAGNRAMIAAQHVGGLATLSQYYEKTGDMAKARSVLDAAPGIIAKLPSAERVRNAPTLQSYRGEAQYEYWKRLAELDERANLKEQALREYRDALTAVDGARTDLLGRQRRLWKELGRSDEAWQAWVDAIPAPASKTLAGPSRIEFTAVHRPIPNITLKDVDGQEWPPDALNKTTVAVVWATWCAPCRDELPYFAKLADRLKGRTDVQAVSFNVDDNPETAKQFLRKSGFTFPALAAKNVAEDLVPYFSIPRTWIIREGAIVAESDGFFAATADDWVESAIGQLNRR